MNGTFTLTITLGNDAMHLHEHIVDALRGVADRIDRDERDDQSRRSGRISDYNGNKVGNWSIVEIE